MGNCSINFQYDNNFVCMCGFYLQRNSNFSPDLVLRVLWNQKLSSFCKFIPFNSQVPLCSGIVQSRKVLSLIVVQNIRSNNQGSSYFSVRVETADSAGMVELKLRSSKSVHKKRHGDMIHGHGPLQRLKIHNHGEGPY